MKYCYFLTLLVSTSCAQLPSFFQAVDDIETDTAILVQVDKEAIQKDTDVYIQVNVQNKDEPVEK